MKIIKNIINIFKKKKEQRRTIKIKEGLFFKEDFKRLPDNLIIYIKDGLLIQT